MKRFSVLLGLALTLAGSPSVWAMQCPQLMDASTPYRCTSVVFNDSGASITSASVVVWDNDDTEYDRSGYPYITTTTTADYDHIAGVMLTPSCPDQSLCQIVVYGWAKTLVADSTDAVAEDTQVSTSTVSGQAGDWGAGGNTCSLGMLLEAVNLEGGNVDTNTDSQVMPVFVNPGCED